MLVTRHLTAAQVVHVDRWLLRICARERLKSCMGQKPELEARTFIGTCAKSFKTMVQQRQVLKF